MCEVCKGINSHNCPICGDQWEMCKCPKCEGSGCKRYWAMSLRSGEEVEVTMETYMTLPETEMEARSKNQHYYKYDTEECDFCGGAGDVWMDGRGEYHKVY